MLLVRLVACSFLGAGLLASTGCANHGTSSSTTGTGTASTGPGSGGGQSYEGVGGVFATSTDLPGGMHTSDASAAYIKTPATSSPCTITHDGACTLVDCVLNGPKQPAATNVSAGLITITGGTRSITLTPQADNTYKNDSSMTALFSGGETLTFDVAGAGDIPHHSGTVVAPHPIAVTAPDFASTLTVDRTKDFVAVWSNGAAGDQVYVVLSSSATDQSRVVDAECLFDAKAGSGAIPSADMGKLLTTGPTVNASAAVVVYRATSVVAGHWNVGFSLDGTAATPSGKGASGPATIQ